jgi:hypothetical protein
MTVSFANRLAIAMASVALPLATVTAAWRGWRQAAVRSELAYNDCMVVGGMSASNAAGCAMEAHATSLTFIAESPAIWWANTLLYLSICWFVALGVWLVWRWVMRGRQHK